MMKVEKPWKCCVQAVWKPETLSLTGIILTRLLQYWELWPFLIRTSSIVAFYLYVTENKCPRHEMASSVKLSIC